MRHHGIAKSFVEKFDDVVKWKWIHLIVYSPDFCELSVSSSTLPYKIAAT